MLKVKRKILSLIMTAAMVTTLFAGLTISASALSGNGTESNPYLITSQADLEAITDLTKYYRLSNSFTVSGFSGLGSPSISSTKASNYSPYVSGGNGFSGTLDGNGCTITVTNRSISTSGRGGVINYLAPGGIVKDLNVTGTITITTGVDAVGGVVGYNSGTIDNVSNSVDVTTEETTPGSGNYYQTYNIGGITGFNNGYYLGNGQPASSGLNGIIVNSSNSGDILGYSKV